MKKDIEFPEVEHVGICAVPDEKEGMKVWAVHIINTREVQIENAMVSSRGYGKKGEEEVKTSQLRHFFELIGPKDHRQIELIPQDLVGLNNQYWVSFYCEGKLYDKKFIFVPDSLLDKNLVQLPVLNTKGILIL